MEKPSFGKSLEEHLNITGREIAFPIEACVTMLLECGMQEEVEGTHRLTQHIHIFVLVFFWSTVTFAYVPLTVKVSHILSYFVLFF